MPPRIHEDEMDPIHYNSDGYPDDLDLDDGFDEPFLDEDVPYRYPEDLDWLPEDEEYDYPPNVTDSSYWP